LGHAKSTTAHSTELRENQRLVLLGPQRKITEGGTWDPAWDKPQ
jgi:hypothetical protein